MGTAHQNNLAYGYLKYALNTSNSLLGQDSLLEDSRQISSVSNPNLHLISPIEKKNQSSLNHGYGLISPNNANHNINEGTLNLSQEAVTTIRRKMELIARELAQNEEIGLDEQTLLRIFECKTEKLLGSSQNHLNFEDGSSTMIGKH
jgi:hypothetical protein